jgi:dihydroorotate dehydrogenase electron transfer subunit
MSIYRIDRGAGEVRFLYKVQGAGTRGLATLAPGDRLSALGPLGQGFHVPKDARHVLLVARGVGLATLAPLAAEAVRDGAHVTGILSARRPDLVMSVDELRDAGATVCCVTDDDDSSDVAQVERRILDLHARMPIDFFATCGSNRLLLLLQRLGETLGIVGQVALEQHMGCALGMCYACVRPLRAAPGETDLTYRRVCHDGPVFDLREALSW